MKGVFIRTASGLVPENDAARESLHGVKLGAMVACEISRPRNLKHHRMFWALCSAIASSVGAHRDNVAEVLKIKTGHFVLIQTKTELLKRSKSISWAEMDQAQFSAFFDQCCRVICEEFLPHMKADGLRSEIEHMVGIPQAA